MRQQKAQTTNNNKKQKLRTTQQDNIKPNQHIKNNPQYTNACKPIKHTQTQHNIQHTIM